MKDLVHKIRVKILKVATRFYVQNYWTFCHQKLRHGCKNRGTVLTVSGPDSAFQKVRFSPFRA
jgi:hypothetical protein